LPGALAARNPRSGFSLTALDLAPKRARTERGHAAPDLASRLVIPARLSN
jgi:hypothetical protein